MKFYLLTTILLSISACSSLQSRYHQAQEGQSLAQIANQYGVTVQDIKKHNRDLASDTVTAGTKVYIPFEKNPAWDAEGSDASDLVSNATPSTASFSWPVFGYISSVFGKRKGRMHEGIDIPAPKGTPVKASRSGHVIYAGNKIRGYGNLVIVRHADTYSTIYAHLSKIDVKKGQFVTRGQQLGKVGRTGRASANHLHFEIRDNRVAVNPLQFLRGQYAHNASGR